MPRKSSTLSKAYDMANEIVNLVKQAQSETAEYIEDAERYRELKPMLNKLAAKTGQETTSLQATGTDKTDQPHDGEYDTGGQNDSQSQIPVKKSRKKKVDNAANTDQTEPDSNGIQ